MNSRYPFTGNPPVTTASVSTPPSPEQGTPAVNCLARFIDTTNVNLTRANEIVETLLSRIEGSGRCEAKDSPPHSNCLMNCAADCNESASRLAERLDYLAKLLTGSC